MTRLRTENATARGKPIEIRTEKSRILRSNLNPMFYKLAGFGLDRILAIDHSDIGSAARIAGHITLLEAEMADTLRVELGAWLEGSTPKKDGKGMRKVWETSPAKIAGERIRLSVIRTHEARDTHVLTLDVGDAAQQTSSLEILGLAADALAKIMQAPAKAPAKAAKPPTPPKPAAKPAPSVAAPAAPAANGAFSASDWASLIG